MLIEMNTCTINGRIFYLDLIKFVGILLVIYGHVELFGFGISSMSMGMIYTFQMPLFFFVSGFLAFKSHKPLGYYLSNTWKKITLLLLPTIVFSFFYALVYKTEVYFLDGFGRYWFGVALLECFIIYYMICIITKTEKQQLFIMVLLSIIGVGYLSTGVGDKYLQVIELNHLAKYLHFFTLGLLAKYYSHYYTKVLNCGIMRTIGIGCFFIIFFVIRYEGFFPIIIERFLYDIILRYLGLYVVVVLLYDSSSKIDLKGGGFARLVGFVAENSFGIYLLQYFFLPDFRGQEWFSNIDEFSMSIICLFYSVTCILACLGVIAIVSRSNFLSRFVLGKR